MTSISTHLCPLVGGGVAIGPLNEVDSLSYPFVHLRHRNNILSLASHAPTTVGTLTAHTARQDRQWLHTEVLAELEILIVTQSHALMVTPRILQATTCLLRTNSGLPTVGIPEAVTTTVYHASTRETHELGLQVGQYLGKVLAQAMSLIGVLRHERYHVNIHHTLVKHQNLQRSVFTVSIGSKLNFIFLPVFGICRNSGISQQLWIPAPALLWLYKCNTYLFGFILIAQEDREVVLGSSLNADTIETVVLDAVAFPTLIVIILLYTLSGQTHVGGIVGMDAVVFANFNQTQRVTRTQHLP